MGILSRLFRKEDAAVTDARRIYTKLMAQSRQPKFYGEGRFPDNYDGRIDVLTLHIASVLYNLNRFGVNGERLGQALFDEMKDDFEIALREEALSDASVKKRIQPMISLFYGRVKKYAEALSEAESKAVLKAAFSETLGIETENESFRNNIADYQLAFSEGLSGCSIGQIALTEFDFPPLGQ